METETNKTPIYDNLLQDENLTSTDKITYILLMKYERFESKSMTFNQWLLSKGLRSQTYTKSKKILQEKNYIKYSKKENKYYFYAYDNEGSLINYNNQQFKLFFKKRTGNYYTPISEQLLFSNLTTNQKLMLIFFEKEMQKEKDLPGYVVHFSTIENLSGIKQVRKVAKILRENNIIDYDRVYTGNNHNSYIKDLFINYDNLESNPINKTDEKEEIKELILSKKFYEKEIENYNKKVVESGGEENLMPYLVETYKDNVKYFNEISEKLKKYNVNEIDQEQEELSPKEELQQLLKEMGI